MGEILMTGGSGGITSDDVTVVKAHILKGETALTADSNDEVIEGEMDVQSIPVSYTHLTLPTIRLV